MKTVHLNPIHISINALRGISFAVTLLCVGTLSAAELTFSGTGSHSPIAVTPESSSGLDGIYVINDTEGVSASYTATTSANVAWYKFSNAGGAYAEPVAVSRNGRTTTLALGNEDMGYIIEEGTTRHFFWIVNYANHPFSLSGVSVSPDSDCYSAMIVPEGTGDRIIYYTINGVPRTLGREITITYQTLYFDEDEEYFMSDETTETFDELQTVMRVPQPLCDTSFTVSGDRFLREWHQEEFVESDSYQTPAVDGHTFAEQTSRHIKNEIKSDGGLLGGSAPVEITFTALVTDAVRFTEWQFSRDPDFSTYELRFNQTEVSYTFREQGTIYVRFQASNNDGTCDYFSETYEVSIGESRLKCPNAFSPGNRDGINDEWKVSYKSIVDFDCHIFNRWGIEVAHLTHPSQGWDGKYNGKTVTSGVYFYVIKARGADGKKYNLSGDINIVKASEKPISKPDGDLTPAE